MDDELDMLRRANPIRQRTGERLAAPHTTAFRETIETAGSRRARARGAGRSGPAHEFRLILVAAAVALVALPALLLVRDNTDEVIIRTPATNAPPQADDEFDPTLPSTTDDRGLVPVVTDLGEADELIGATAGDDPPAATTTEVTTTTVAVPGSTTPGASDPSTAIPSSAAPAESSDAATPVTVATTTATTIAATASGAPTTDAATAPAEAPPTTVAATLPAATTPPTTPAEPPSTGAAPSSTAPPVSRSAAVPGGPFDPASDLLMVTLDFAHLDDGHSALATRELATTYGVAPVVVAGTAAPESDRFTHDYASLMSATWGGDWFDAGADRAAARANLTQRWLSVIDSGGEIWVAEGGVSDFTAAVLGDVREQRPGLDTSGIVHVIHHIAGNLDGTQPAERQLLDAQADMVRIDDGNNVNGTAGLNGASTIFEDIALAGPSASTWATAFDYFPASSLDFSDTVTVLHVLGIGTDAVANVDDFAAVVMS